MKSHRPTIILTIDVEDWPQSSWNRSLPLGDYCAENTRRVLHILGRHPKARATFFILGKFAKKHPSVVRAIARAGHEIASHGYGHMELFHMSPEEFAEDLKRSVGAITDACGVIPTGYRAPDFSLVGETLWALDILAGHGFSYDSSIVPVDKGRYGIEKWPINPTKVDLKSGKTILEVPLGLMKIFGKSLPTGGGYARLLPKRTLSKSLKNTCRLSDSPPVFYLHPYELDPNEFNRLTFTLPIKVKLHQGIGRKGTADKLLKLLGSFNCCSVKDAVTQKEVFQTTDQRPFMRKPNTVSRPPIFKQTKSSG